MPLDINKILDQISSDGENVVVRNMVINDFTKLIQDIDSGEAKTNTGETTKNWTSLSIYADQIQLKFDSNSNSNTLGIDITNNKTLKIFARKMTITGNGFFTIVTRSKSTEPQAFLSIQEYNGSNPIRCITNATIKGSVSQDLLPSPENCNSIEGKISFGSALTIDELTKPMSDWKIPSDFYWLLTNTFQNGFTVSLSDKEEAYSMFRWIAHNTLGIPWIEDTGNEMGALGVQAYGFAGTLSTPADINYVPKLNIQSYLSEITRDIESAIVFESDYETFSNEAISFENRKMAVDNSVKFLKDNVANLQDMINTRQTQLENVTAELEKDIESLQNQLTVLADAEKDFEDGIKKLEMKSVVSLVRSLGEAAIGLFTGEPEEGVEAVGTFAKLTKQLKKVVEGVEKVYEMAEKMDEVYKNFQDMDSLKSDTSDITADFNSYDTLTDTDWEVLLTEFESDLEPYTSGEDEIDGAAEYLEAAKVLVIYGEAVNSDRASAASLQQEISELSGKIKTFNNQESRLEDYSNSENENKELFNEAALIMQQKYMDVKRSLLLSINNFNDAFRYWSLSEPQTDALDYNSQISDMNEVLVGMNTVIDTSLNNYNTRQSPVICHISYPLSDKEKNTLASGGTIKIPVDMNSQAFNGRDRVRVYDAKICLSGLENISTNMKKTFCCNVVDSGNYKDRMGSCNADTTTIKTWNFTTDGALSFKYSNFVTALSEQENIDTNYIINNDSYQGESGDLGQASGTPFFLPTLFTTWSVTMPHSENDNSTLDFSAVDSIKLICYGFAS